MSVLIGGLLLGAGVLLFVLEPVFSGKSAPMYDGDDVFDEGAARRRVALTALRDLEYDRATGKLDEDDYGQLRTELSREALEHLGDEGGGKGGGRGADGGRGPDRASRELEEEIAELRRAIREGMQCSACEHLNRLGARYCARCGEGLGGGVGGRRPPLERATGRKGA